MAVLPSSWAASGLLHAVAFGSLVVVSRREVVPGTNPAPLPVEYRVELSPPRAPPAAAAASAPEPTPKRNEVPRELPDRRTSAPARSVASPVIAAEQPAEDGATSGPLDLTGAGVGGAGTFALQVGGGSGLGGGGRVAPSASAAPAVSQTPVIPTPSAELSRLPVPPDLGAALLAHYPSRARAAGESGTAVVSLVVLPDGRVSEVVVRSASTPDFGRACVETLRSSRWLGPIDRHGRPTLTRVGYTCAFDVR